MPLFAPAYGATKEKLKDGFNVGLRHSELNQEIATNGTGTIGRFAQQQFSAAHCPFRGQWIKPLAR
jgi:hypothetical protein